MRPSIHHPLVPALLLAVSSGPARALEDFAGYTWFVGDPHVHTGVSGDGHSSDISADPPPGCGAFAEVLDIALANGLDWVALTEHVNGGASATDVSWGTELTMLLDHDDDATGLVVVPAAELGLDLAGGGSLGHRNVYLFGTDEDLRSLSIVDVRPRGTSSTVVPTCADLWTWLDGLSSRFGPVLLVPHHPYGLLPTPVDFTCHSDVYEPFVEVYSSWGSGLGDWTLYDLPVSGGVATGAVHYAMDPDGLALRLGFWGGTDSHYTTPGDLCSALSLRGRHVSTGGLTLVAVPEGEPWNRANLHEALLRRRTVALSGPAVPLMAEYRADGELLGILGGDLRIEPDTELEVLIRVPEAWAPAVLGAWLTGPSDHVELDAVAANEFSITLAPDEIPEWFYPSLRIDALVAMGDDYCDDGTASYDEWAWGSPSWIQVLLPDADGDGWSIADGDCDDADPAISPSASEIIGDEIDQDCDGHEICYRDYDADGYRATRSFTSSDTDCRDEGEATRYAPAGDCNDLDAAIHPGATEILGDGVDQDCDGMESCHGDLDADGYRADVPILSADLDCDDAGEVGPELPGGDCDDTNAAVHPGAAEVCDGLDDDCDGNRDGDDAIDRRAWYVDADGDTWPVDGEAILACEAPAGRRLASDPWDCDDADALVYPGSAEVRGDGVDQDCDGQDLELLDTEDSGEEDTGADDSAGPSDTGGGSGPPKRACLGCDASETAGLARGLPLLLLFLGARRRSRRGEADAGSVGSLPLAP